MKINKYSDLQQSRTVHIFDYYDFPLFFISQSPNAEYYLSYYIDNIENNVDKWFFSRISNNERLDLIEQRISVLTLLQHLFNKQRLYHLFIDSNLNNADVDLKKEVVNSTNFDQESFPEEDFFVEYDFVTKKHLFKVERDVLDASRFKVAFSDSENRHDIGLDFLLGCFKNIKETLNDIANDILKKTFDGKSNHSINLRVDAFQPSSFGIWLKTEPLDADLFEIPEKSLTNLFELIADVSMKSQEEIEEQIMIDENYSIETMGSIKNLLKNISDNDFSLKLEGTTKSNIVKEVKFDKNSYKKLSILDNILRENSKEHVETIEIEGELISINTSKNSFSIQMDTVRISGKMSKQIFKELKMKNQQFIVPSPINATIEKRTVKDLVNNESSESYTLTNYEQSRQHRTPS